MIRRLVHLIAIIFHLDINNVRMHSSSGKMSSHLKIYLIISDVSLNIRYSVYHSHSLSMPNARINENSIMGQISVSTMMISPIAFGMLFLTRKAYPVSNEVHDVMAIC